MPPTLTVEHVDDLDFWRELFPEFSIDEAERETPRFPVSDPDQLLECIRSEGYVRVPSVVPADSVDWVRRCIHHLSEAGIPLPFAPLNGCIHALPLRLDDRFKYWAFGGEGSSMVLQPQNIRALPAPAGALLAWNHNLLHWGGRASRLAAGPRCSAAMEFQRADMKPREIPAVDPTYMLTFQEQLALIGRMIVHYQDTYPLGPEMAEAAVALWN